ncbi:Putative membrane-bound metal-dependent hydrolase [Planktothrix tepida]|uniref:Membrane-bound metal-dependent hydrolase n=2 Tax=Planktothrix TaxID=54304 RepID=A0A9W4CQT7_9CYAN|nr:MULTISPECIES: metal-dependent hydrolase [Planktothrix]CAD5936007.1 Putative membrane-bound metal-dependent hydrolase [Planktothrix tepida]CAD5975515.1 Putative membrane-bound metal-dependent hydrolase [Planktothrix pseudagardhii]CUR33427.1 putative membrane-bound metal-dependent hydrolase [Planktothrix tepida PCC 9214]
MPSPLFHATAGYFLGKYLPSHIIPKSYPFRRFDLNILYPVFIATCADFDFMPQILTGIEFHRGISHSLIFTLGFSLIISWVASKIWKISYQQLFRFTLILYSSHLILDFFAEGRGIKLFLPFLDQFFKSPILLFPGVHYSLGWFHPSHLVSLSYELLLTVVLYQLLTQWQAYKAQKATLSTVKNNIHYHRKLKSKSILRN